MNILKKILVSFWRIWFYILVLSISVILFPIFLIVISNKKWYAAFYWLARLWAMIILFFMGFIPKVTKEETCEPGKSYVLCPNHTSIIDIMMMLYISKYPIVFLGKKELADIPVFGYVYKRTCILVDRNNNKSKSLAFQEAKKRLENGISVCIFPEGKVPDNESIVLDTFKNGAFRLAIMFHIPIVPISIYDCKKHFSFTFLSGSPGILRARVLPFIHTESLADSDFASLREQTRNIIYTDLVRNINAKESN